MSISTLARSGFYFTALSTLVACSSGSDTPAPGDEADGVDTGDQSTVLFGTAQYITSDCGSVPVSATAASTSRTAPGLFNVGEIVRGQLVPGTAENGFHIWQIELAPGNYHIVADTAGLNEERAAIYLQLIALGATSADDEVLATDSDFDFDIRLHDFLEVREARVLQLKVEETTFGNEVQNYTLGVFANGSAVPSPTFERCLPITALAAGTTESAALQGIENRTTDLWYQLDLNVQPYKLDATTRVAVSDAVGYEFTLLSQFGQISEKSTITAVSEFTSELVSGDNFTPNTEGKSWIRVRNAYVDDPDINVEFTIGTP